MTPVRGRALPLVLALGLAACTGGGGGGEDDARDPVVDALEEAGYFEATGAADGDEVVRTFRGLCGRLDAERDEAARFTILVGFLRSSPGIDATGGWPAARVAGVVVPVLCPAHEATLARATATVH